jgi:hypothetical protein
MKVDQNVSWVWLSFVDPARPDGSQFLGCAIVPGDDVVTGAKSAWMLGCNPGGEVAGAVLPSGAVAYLEEEYIARILTREEAMRVSAVLEKGVN